MNIKFNILARILNKITDEMTKYKVQATKDK